MDDTSILIKDAYGLSLYPLLGAHLGGSMLIRWPGAHYIYPLSLVVLHAHHSSLVSGCAVAAAPLLGACVKGISALQSTDFVKSLCAWHWRGEIHFDNINNALHLISLFPSPLRHNARLIKQWKQLQRVMASDKLITVYSAPAHSS